MTESLSASHALAIVDNCPFPLLVFDSGGCVSSYNHAFERLVGRVQATELQGHELSSVGNHPARAFLGRETTISWTDQNDHAYQFEIHRVELKGEHPSQVRFFVDISKQVDLEQAHGSLNDELQQHILTDSLTGLLNQRGVILALEPQVARSRRYNSPISIILMDIQTGKNRNTALVDIARLLKDQLRWADLIGCNDQHEFILVLPETTPEAALQLADKLEKRLKEMALSETGDQTLQACYGVTGWRKSDTATTLLKRASLALARARSEQSDHSVAL